MIDDARPASGASCRQRARRSGRVRTGIAVRAGEPAPDDRRRRMRCARRSLAATRALLSRSRALDRRHPFRRRAASGSAFASAVARALRTFPNGATAMRDAGRSAASAGAIGCTQVTEILLHAGRRAGRRAAGADSSSRRSTPPQYARRRANEMSTRPGSYNSWQAQNRVLFACAAGFEP